MAMMGMSEIAILFAMLFGGGAGIPLSLPPAAPDALLDRVSPDEAVFYSLWSGVGSLDPQSENPTEKLFAEPEVQEMIARMEKLARAALAKAGENNPGARMASEVMPTAVRAALTQPMMVYVKDIEIQGETPTFKAGLVTNLGANFGAVQRLLKMIPEAGQTDVEIDGVAFKRFQPPGEGAPAITYGTRGAYLIVAVGEGEAEALMARAKTETPTWLGDLRSRFPVDRVATVTRFDLAAAMSIAKPLAGPQLQGMLKLTGLDGVKEYSAVTGLDNAGFAHFAALDIEGEPRGILALAPEQPVVAGDLAALPIGSLVAMAGKMDLTKVMDGVLEIVGSADPNAIDQFNDAVRQVEGVLGMRIREDVLASLGDVWTLHTHEEDGGLLSGWTLTVSLKNPSKMGQLSQSLMQLGNQMARGPRDPKIQWNQFDGKNLFTVAVPAAEMPFAPTWSVVDDHLVIGVFPQAIKSYLARQKVKGKSVADEPAVAAALEKGPTSVAVVNHKRFAELLYPMAQISLRMAAGQASRQGIQLDTVMLPSLTSITRHLGTGVTASRRTERGFEFEQHQVLPGGSVGATAPMSIALLLPAVQSARQSARRMQSLNNMKQIALAFHNFHDTYRSFPPRYNTDANGKPLLSWRVYLLPYLEQQALYERFKLDEPWDSEHNKQLIPLMPKTYMTPSTPLPPGKTTYLTIASKEAMMQGPREGENGKNMPRSNGFRDVTDGTSNTVMIVEGNAQSAVTWTKPDDYEYTDADPAKGLRGVYPKVILLGMGDGSVRAVTDQIDPKTLKALFTRAGGEVIDHAALSP